MSIALELSHAAGRTSRPLSEAIVDALREAVIVVDVKSPHFPLIMANEAARRSFLGDIPAISLVDSSLYSLLGEDTDAAVAAALSAAAVRPSSITRVLHWRFPRGEIPLSTDLTLLESDPGHPLVMLSFFQSLADPLSEAAVRSAVDQIPLDLLILDTELTVTYANGGAARAAGAQAHDLMGLSALILAPTSALPREALTAALEGRYFHDDAVAVTTPGVPTRWFEVDLQPLTNQSTIVGVSVLSQEVTERRRQRRATSGTERRLVALTEHAREIITVTDSAGRMRYVSGGIVNSLGYTPEERLAQSIFEHVHPEDVETLKLKYAELVAGFVPSFSRQMRVRHKDGTYRWLEWTCHSALDNPLVHGVVVNARDITERKAAETRLAQREEVFKLAADAVHGIIFEWDLSQSVIHRSRGVHDVLGMEPKDVAAVGAWSARIHPHDYVSYSEKTAAALASGRGWTASYRIRNSHGRYRSILERALIQRGANGEPVRAIGCAVDVSEIKRLTDLLEEAQQVAHIGSWEYTYETRELEWTEEMYRIYETTVADFRVSWGSMMAQCPPESRVRLNQAIEEAESGDGRMDVELEILSLRGRRFWARVVGHIEKLDGRPFRAFGSVQDIQAQKLAQIGLENSTEWLKLSMNMASMHAWRWTRGTDTLEFAIAEGQSVNLPRAFPGMRRLLSRVHRKDRLAVRRAIEHAFARHTEVHKEFRLRAPGGHYRTYATVARPLYDAQNQPAGLVGVTQDVTAWHESQARLRRSEALLRTTTANTADTLILVDTDLRIRFINRDTLGWGIDTLVGSDVSVLVPEQDQESVAARLRRVLATGSAVSYEFAVPQGGGEIDFFENRAVLVREDGIRTGISITMRNITERKRLEKEILAVSSRERHSIGRDLHDGLGQELTGVALMLRGLAARLETRCPETLPQVEEVMGLVNQSVQTARSLARGLLPLDTVDGGLAGALHALAERSQDLYGLKVVCRLSVSPEPLPDVTSKHLYRIAQEALTNAARHAKATRVHIFFRVTGTQFLLRIGDDGIGMPKAGESSGMGLKIMRYRAGIIGATFEVQPHVPHGTLIVVAGQYQAVTDKLTSAFAI